MKTVKGVKIDSGILSTIKNHVTKTSAGTYLVTAESFAGVKASEILNDYMTDMNRFAKANGEKFEVLGAAYGDFDKSYEIIISDVMIESLVDQIIA